MILEMAKWGKPKLSGASGQPTVVGKKCRPLGQWRQTEPLWRITRLLKIDSCYADGAAHSWTNHTKPAQISCERSLLTETPLKGSEGKKWVRVMSFIQAVT